MSLAALSETTFTSPDASRLARSVTFRFAFAAVGVHTPAEQLMFCVALSEITTAALAAHAPKNIAAKMTAAVVRYRALRIFEGMTQPPFHSPPEVYLEGRGPAIVRWL